MLHWRWDEVIGEIIYDKSKFDEKWAKGNWLKKRILVGNCLGVVSHWSEPSIYYGTTKACWVAGDEYWLDKEHLETMLGLRTNHYYGAKINSYDKVQEVRINTYYGKDAKTIADAFAKAKIKVVLFYKEPKKGAK